MSDRLDASALHFKSVSVEGFRGIRGADMEFQHHNIIVGLNGVGKTTMLNLLGGIAGSDTATELVAGQKIGSIKMVLGAGNEEFVFEAKDFLDPKEIAAFKATLPEGKRANYGLTDNYFERYQYGEGHAETFHASLERFWKLFGSKPHVFVTPGRSVKMDPGSGVEQAIRLLYLSSFREGPLLIDNPETSLDHWNKHHLSVMVQDRWKQTISVTHSYEWADSIKNKINMAF